MKSSSKFSSDLFELETSLHQSRVRASPEAVSKLLADEFKEFTSSGRVFDKPAIIEALRNESAYQSPAVEEFAARDLAPDVVLVTYIASRQDGSRLENVRTLRSSIWKLIDGRWQMIFHQGTRIPGS